MKKHSIICKRRSFDKGMDTYLDYRLILTDKNEYDLLDSQDVYSVLILQIEGGITTDYDFLYDIARDEENAVAILDLLVYNDVMPSNARDVMAEII